MSDAKQTPLIDLLRGVPESARALREVNEHQHQNVPYGRLMNEAADEIEALKAERDLHRNRCAAILFGGGLDTVTAGEVQDWVRDYVDAKAERDALRTALEVVLNDLMYKDHAKVIDFARAALKAREVKP